MRNGFLWSTLGVLLLAALLAAPGASAQNLLANGDFAKSDGKGGPAGWGFYPREGFVGASVRLAPKAFSGKPSVLMTTPDETQSLGLYAQPMPVADLPGEEILFTCYYRTEGAASTSLSLVGYLDSFLSQEWKTPYLQSETQVLPPQKNWTPFVWRFRWVPGVRELVPMFRLTGAGKLYLAAAAAQPYPPQVACKVVYGGAVEALPSRRLVQVEVTNRDTRAHNLQLSILAQGEKRKVDKSSPSTSLAAGQTASLRLNYDFDYRLAHVLTLTVQDPDSGMIYERREISTPGLIEATLAAPAFRSQLIETVPTPQLVVVGATNVVPALQAKLQVQAELVGVGGGAFAPVAGTEPPAFRLALPTPTLMAGDHVVRVSARLPGGEQVVDLPLSRLSPGLSAVAYDDSLRLWMGNRRIFPLGLYGINTPEDVTAAAAAGFNFVIASAQRASYEVSKAAHASNLAVVISSTSTNEGYWEHEQTKWGSDSACLGWLPYSRPDVRSYPADQVLGMYHEFTRLSPNHPVIEPLASPSLAEYYAGAADILMAWSLPVPNSPLRALGEMVDRLREYSRGRKPVWAVVQAMGGAAFRDEATGPQKTGRSPSPAEMEALAYVALVHGADGLVWYTFNSSEDTANTMALSNPDMWAAVTALQTRLRWLLPALLDGQRETLPPAAGGVLEMARWRYQEAVYVCAVNTGDRGLISPVPVGAPNATVQVMFEDREVKSDADGEVQDSFAPFGVHVYSVGGK
ncbi:MAG TPA: hypothetical protein VGM19_11345 [Armatimonadota bacterium]|jgi:hypothetical protein